MALYSSIALSEGDAMHLPSMDRRSRYAEAAILSVVRVFGTNGSLNATSWRISTLVLLSALPVFGFGLAEDLG